VSQCDGVLCWTLQLDVVRYRQMSGRAGRALPGSDASTVGESFIMIPVQREEHVAKLIEHGRRLHRSRRACRTGLSLSAPPYSGTTPTTSAEPVVAKLQAKVDLAENLMWSPLEPVYSQLKSIPPSVTTVVPPETASTKQFVKLTKCGLRRALLEAIGTGIASTLSECQEFVQSTLFGYQRSEVESVVTSVNDTMKFLISKRFIMPCVDVGSGTDSFPEAFSAAAEVIVPPNIAYVCTQVGRAAFVSGLRYDLLFVPNHCGLALSRVASTGG
jgi:hypothetical protein